MDIWFFELYDLDILLTSNKILTERQYVNYFNQVFPQERLLLFTEKNLLDYIENFVLYHKDGAFKIIAKNQEFMLKPLHMI